MGPADTQQPGEREQNVPPIRLNTTTEGICPVPEGIRTAKQEDLLGRPDGLPKLTEYAPDGQYDQQEHLLNMSRHNMREWRPENTHDKRDDLIDHTLPAH